MVEINPQDLASYFHHGLYLASSNISGTGLFTSTNIPAGEVVIRFGGNFFPSSLARSEAIVASTTVYVSETVVLGTPQGCDRDFSDYLNHSCSPNLGMKDAITLISVRDIPAQSELTTDYSFWEGDPNYKLKQVCNCQSQSCRKSITGRDWTGQIKSSSYRDYYSPFLKRRSISEEDT